jgi:glycosyltransferase involved in cell wall biosynthesis
LTSIVLDRTTAQPPSAELPTVSVVIPTYNRAKMLGITLESFVHQHYPKNRFEIVVADNNSGDETRQVVEEWQRRSAVSVKYVFEKRQGVHYARNTAAWQTSGDILYYTDDDMIASRELLEEIVKPFSMDPRVGSATGRILPQWEVLPPEWILKLCNNFRLSLNDLGEQMLIQEKDPGVYSCHMAMRRGIFFQSGGFNPENTAGEWIGDGETGLNIKIKELGYKFAYNGKAVIRHMIPPQRMTQEYLNKRLANQGNCDSYTDYKKHRYSEKQLIERIAGHQAKIVEHSAHYAARRLNNDLHWRMDRAFIDYYLNRVEYDHRLIHDAQWRELVLRYDWLNEGMPEQCEGKERAFVSPLDEIRRSLEVLNGALA